MKSIEETTPSSTNVSKFDLAVRKCEKQGYAIMTDVLSAKRLKRLESAVDRIWNEERQKGHKGNRNLFIPNFLGMNAAFVDLVDHPVVLSVVCQILGWNIYLYHCHLGVTPRESNEDEPMKMPLNFHQDSGRVNRDIETHPRPRLSLKVAYWLSDLSEPGRGNFYVVPGSHLTDKLERPQSRLPDGAVPVCVEAGDVVLFDRRLWHARSPNHSPVVRKVLYYGYGYRWIRTKDEMTIPDEFLEGADPIRRQLLGISSSANARFSPGDDDVPLRAAEILD